MYRNLVFLAVAASLSAPVIAADDIGQLWLSQVRVVERTEKNTAKFGSSAQSMDALKACVHLEKDYIDIDGKLEPSMEEEKRQKSGLRKQQARLKNQDDAMPEAPTNKQDANAVADHKAKLESLNQAKDAFNKALSDYRQLVSDNKDAEAKLTSIASEFNTNCAYTVIFEDDNAAARLAVIEERKQKAVVKKAEVKAKAEKEAYDNRPVGKADLKRLQIALIRLGYTPGIPDGTMGKNTYNELTAYQLDYGLPFDNKVTHKMISDMEAIAAAAR